MQANPDQPKHAPAPESPRGYRYRFSGFWFWPCVLVFVVYPLSVGPAVKLMDTGLLSYKVVEPVYYPLGKAAKYCPPVHAFFDWYLGEVWNWRPVLNPY